MPDNNQHRPQTSPSLTNRENKRLLLAPNGEQSNLSPELYAYVRTPEFKQWFGDWLLPYKTVDVVPTTIDHGFNNFKEATKWAIDNIVRTYNDEETGHKGNIRISANAIHKFLSSSSVDNSDSKDIHLSILKILPEIIKTSFDAETHKDYNKGTDGVRDKANGFNPSVLIHRLYGAAQINNDTFRVKVTLKAYKDLSAQTKAYNYEATKIELMEGSLRASLKGTLPRTTNNSITLAKLLKNVEKSYEKGKKLLDHSRILDNNGEPLVLYRGQMSHANVPFVNHGDGIYFTPQREAAIGYGLDHDPIPVFLNARNPYEVDFDGDSDTEQNDYHGDIKAEYHYAESEDFDILIATNTFDGENDLDQYVVINNEQVLRIDLLDVQKIISDVLQNDLDSNGMSIDNDILRGYYNLQHLVLSKKNEYVTLSQLVAEQQGQGDGSRFMNDLTNMADINGWTLALTPDTSLGASSINRLKDFYQKFGFKDNKGENADFNTKESMTRTPQITPDRQATAVQNDLPRQPIDFQFVGEFGARQLDNANRSLELLLNLATAKEMTEAGKDPLTVKMATGWERGIDNKWRYEIPDFKINSSSLSLLRNNFPQDKPTTLDELMPDSPVLSAYPQMRSLQVVNDKKRPMGAAYDPENNIIKIGAVELHIHDYDDLNVSNVSEILMYEIQHAIQHIEGFATGISALAITDAQKKEAKQQMADLQDIYNEYMMINAYTFNDDPHVALMAYQQRDDFEKEHEAELKAYLLAKQKLQQAEEEELTKKLSEENYNKYLSVAGEVEAKNVVTRSEMSPEERKNSLAAATEDVARENQTVIFNGLSNLIRDHQTPLLHNDMMLRDGLIRLMQNAGIAVSTDWQEGQAVLDLANSEVRFKKEEHNGLKNTSADERNGGVAGSPATNTDQIIAQAQADGSYLKEPNGNNSDLQDRQWAQVSTDNFKHWFGDWQNPVIYTAYNVDDPKALKRKYPSALPDKYYHHSTNKYGRQPFDEREGEQKRLHIIGRLTTEKVDCLLVENPNSNNKYPHITLATAKGIKPFESNAEIAKHQDMIQPLDDYVDTTFINNISRDVSKLIDKKGEPMILYHGTNTEFYTFKQKEGVRYTIGIPIDVKSQGFFLTDDKDLAEDFARSRYRQNNEEGKPQVMDIYVSMKKPADLSELTNESEELFYKIAGFWPAVTMGYETIDKWWQIADDEEIDIDARLKELGYDGIIFAEEIYEDGKTVAKSYFVTNPNQIKSATLNNGEFSLENNDIRFQLANSSSLSPQATAVSERPSQQPIFISNALLAIQKINQQKATPQQWLGMIQNLNGIKPGEDRWTGLSDWLRNNEERLLTKQQVLDYIAEHQIQINETYYMNVEDTPQFANLYDEFVREINNAEDLYDEAFEEYADFLDKMKEKYGQNFDYDHDLTKEERDEGEELLEIRESYNTQKTPSRDTAFNLMAEKYGKNFEEAFDYDGDILFIADENKAAEFLDINVKQIDDTRLRYSTENLDNKKEIALTVPNIESWDPQDYIHFGDADNGRTIAWARFGDATYLARLSEKEIQERIEKRPAADQWIKTENIAGYEYANEMFLDPNNRKNFVYTDEEGKYHIEFNSAPNNWHELDNNQIRAARRVGDTFDTLKEAVSAYDEYIVRCDSRSERVLVIDEIQSKRHQNGREKGYKKESFDSVVKEVADNYSVTEERVRNNPSDVANAIQKYDPELAERLRTAYSDQRSPAAPFENNWHELVMKRMLRYAAENDYDRIAWTTGEQQTNRYDLSKFFNEISVVETMSAENLNDYFGNDCIKKDGKVMLLSSSMGDDDYSLAVDEEGTIIYCHETEKLEGKKLDQLVGKALADKLLEADHQTFSGENIRIGGEGMTAFYDHIIPNFVNKYAKKWNAHTEDVFLPDLDYHGITMHSVPVTPQMKQDVMQGQLMFFLTNKGDAYGFTKDNTIYIDPRIATSETPIHEYAHLWAQAIRQYNQEEWQNIVQLMKQVKPVWEMVQSQYSHLSTDSDIAEEVLAQYSGKQGLKNLEKALKYFNKDLSNQEAQNILERIKAAIDRFWQKTADFLHIHYNSADEVAERVMHDLLNQVNPQILAQQQQTNNINTQAPSQISNSQPSDSIASINAIPSIHSVNDQNTILAYSTAPYLDVQSLAHGVKDGDTEAIKKAAARIADVINVIPDKQNLVLVPMPSHNGNATYTMTLAEEVAKLTGLTTADILSVQPHQPLYDYKLKNGIQNIPIPSFNIKEDFPKDKIPLIIDNVLDTGTTAYAAAHAFGTDTNARIAVLGNTDNFYLFHNGIVLESEKLLDIRYLNAVERGDLETAQQMVNAQAQKMGYSLDDIERDAHIAPCAALDTKDFRDLNLHAQNIENSEDVNLFAVANGISPQPDDYFTHPMAPKWYMYNDQSGMESQSAILSAIKNIQYQTKHDGEVKEMPKVTVFRAVPKEVREDHIRRNGEWVSPSLSYAINHGEHRLGIDNYRIIKEAIPADQLWWDGNDIREWGVDDGRSYAFRNTPNNAKLLDPVTYDDKGNIIPLSQRFNPQNADIHFQLAGQQGATQLDSIDHKGRIENLHVAQQMERDNRSPKEIKMATGWERGVDRKWRYELADIYLKQGTSLAEYADLVAQFRELNEKGTQRAFRQADRIRQKYLIMTIKEKTLGEILDPNADILKAYPSLADAKLKFIADLFNALRGYYDPKNDTIMLNLKHFKSQDDVRSTIVHEIQHFIQEKEGFAPGANLEQHIPDVVVRDVHNQIDDLQRRIRVKQEQLEDIHRELPEMRGLLDQVKAAFKSHGSGSPEIIKAMQEVKAFRVLHEEKFNIAQQLNAEIDDNKKRIEKLHEYLKDDVMGYDNYARTAGEVEARNVQSRMLRNPAINARSLAAATEDTPRSEQIILLENNNSSDNISQNFTTMPTNPSEKSDFLQDFLDSKSKLQAGKAKDNLNKLVRFEMPDGKFQTMTNAEYIQYAVKNDLRIAATPEKGNVPETKLSKIQRAFTNGNYYNIVRLLGGDFKATPEMKNLEKVMQKGWSQENRDEYINARNAARESIISANTPTKMYYHVQIDNNGASMPISKTMYDYGQFIQQQTIADLTRQLTDFMNNAQFNEWIQEHEYGVVPISEGDSLRLREGQIEYGWYNNDGWKQCDWNERTPSQRINILREGIETATDIMRDVQLYSRMELLHSDRIALEQPMQIHDSNGNDVTITAVAFDEPKTGPYLITEEGKPLTQFYVNKENFDKAVDKAIENGDQQLVIINDKINSVEEKIVDTMRTAGIDSFDPKNDITVNIHVGWYPGDEYRTPTFIALNGNHLQMMDESGYTFQSYDLVPDQNSLKMLNQAYETLQQLTAQQSQQTTQQQNEQSANQSVAVSQQLDQAAVPYVAVPQQPSNQTLSPTTDGDDLSAAPHQNANPTASIDATPSIDNADRLQIEQQIITYQNDNNSNILVGPDTEVTLDNGQKFNLQAITYDEDLKKFLMMDFDSGDIEDMEKANVSDVQKFVTNALDEVLQMQREAETKQQLHEFISQYASPGGIDLKNEYEGKNLYIDPYSNSLYVQDKESAKQIESFPYWDRMEIMQQALYIAYELKAQTEARNQAIADRLATPQTTESAEQYVAVPQQPDPTILSLQLQQLSQTMAKYNIVNLQIQPIEINPFEWLDSRRNEPNPNGETVKIDGIHRDTDGYLQMTDGNILLDGISTRPLDDQKSFIQNAMDAINNLQQANSLANTEGQNVANSPSPKDNQDELTYPQYLQQLMQMAKVQSAALPDGRVIDNTDGELTLKTQHLERATDKEGKLSLQEQTKTTPIAELPKDEQASLAWSASEILVDFLEKDLTNYLKNSDRHEITLPNGDSVKLDENRRSHDQLVFSLHDADGTELTYKDMDKIERVSTMTDFTDMVAQEARDLFLQHIANRPEDRLYIDKNNWIEQKPDTNLAIVLVEDGNVKSKSLENVNGLTQLRVVQFAAEQQQLIDQRQSLAENMSSLGLDKLNLPTGESLELVNNELVLHGFNEDATPKDIQFSKLGDGYQSTLSQLAQKEMDKINMELASQQLKLAAMLEQQPDHEVSIDNTVILYKYTDDFDKTEHFALDHINTVWMDKQGEIWARGDENHLLQSLNAKEQLEVGTAAIYALSYYQQAQNEAATRQSAQNLTDFGQIDPDNPNQQSDPSVAVSQQLVNDLKDAFMDSMKEADIHTLSILQNNERVTFDISHDDIQIGVGVDGDFTHVNELSDIETVERLTYAISKIDEILRERAENQQMENQQVASQNSEQKTANNQQMVSPNTEQQSTDSQQLTSQNTSQETADKTSLSEALDAKLQDIDKYYQSALDAAREHLENTFPDSWISLSNPLKHDESLAVIIDGKDTGIEPVVFSPNEVEKQPYGFAVTERIDNPEAFELAKRFSEQQPDKIAIGLDDFAFYNIQDALDFKQQLDLLPEVNKLNELEQQAAKKLPNLNPYWSRDDEQQIEGAKLMMYGVDSGIRAEYLQPAPLHGDKGELGFAVGKNINAQNIDSLTEIYAAQHPDHQMVYNGGDDLTVKFTDIREAVQFHSFVQNLIYAEPKLTETQAQNMADIKDRYPDTLVLNRNGEAYEAYGKDAQRLSSLLEIPTRYNNGYAVTMLDVKDIDKALPEIIAKGQHVTVVDSKELGIRAQAKVMNEIGTQLLNTFGEGHHSLIGHPPTDELPGFHLTTKGQQGYMNISSIDLSHDKIPTVVLNSDDHKSSLSLLQMPLDQQQNLLQYAKALHAYQKEQQADQNINRQAAEQQQPAQQQSDQNRIPYVAVPQQPNLSVPQQTEATQQQSDLSISLPTGEGRGAANPLADIKSQLRDSGLVLMPVKFTYDDRRYMDTDGMVRTPFLDFSAKGTHQPETVIAPVSVEYQKANDQLLLHGKNFNGDYLTIPLETPTHDNQNAYLVLREQLEQPIQEARQHANMVQYLADDAVQSQKVSDTLARNLTNNDLRLPEGGKIHISEYDNEKQQFYAVETNERGHVVHDDWVKATRIAEMISKGEAVAIKKENLVEASLSFPSLQEVTQKREEMMQSEQAKLNEKYLNTVFSFDKEDAVVVSVRQDSIRPWNPTGIELGANSTSGSYFTIVPDSPDNKFIQTGNKLDGIVQEITQKGFIDRERNMPYNLMDPISYSRDQERTMGPDQIKYDGLMVDFGPNHFYFLQTLSGPEAGKYTASYKIENLNHGTLEKVEDADIDLAYDRLRHALNHYDLRENQSHSVYETENLVKDITNNQPDQMVTLESRIHNVPTGNKEMADDPNYLIMDVSMIEVNRKGDVILHGNGGPAPLDSLEENAKFEVLRRAVNDMMDQNLDLPVKKQQLLDHFIDNYHFIDAIKPFEYPQLLYDKDGKQHTVGAVTVDDQKNISLFRNTADANYFLMTKNADRDASLFRMDFNDLSPASQRKVLDGALNFYSSPKLQQQAFQEAEDMAERMSAADLRQNNVQVQTRQIDENPKQEQQQTQNAAEQVLPGISTSQNQEAKVIPLFDEPKFLPNVINEYEQVMAVLIDGKKRALLFHDINEAKDYAQGGQAQPIRMDWFTKESQDVIVNAMLETAKSQKLTFTINMSNQNSDVIMKPEEQKPQVEQQKADPEVKNQEKAVMREAAAAAIIAAIGTGVNKLRLADDERISLSTNKGATIDVQTVSVSKNSSISLYGEMDGTKKSISVKQLTDDSISRLATHLDDLRTSKQAVTVEKPVEQKADAQVAQKPAQTAEQKPAQQAEQKPTQNNEQKPAQTAEQKADQPRERKVEPIEIKPDSKVQVNVVPNKALDHVYDIQIYLDGQKQGRGHHLSIEDRKAFFEQKTPQEKTAFAASLLPKYFEKELAGQKLPDNIERYQPERKAAQANEQKAAQTAEQKPAQNTEQKADQPRERKVEPIVIKPDSKVQVNVVPNKALDHVYDIQIYLDGQKQGRGHHLSIEDRKAFFEQKTPQEKTAFAASLLPKYFEKELAGQKLPDNIERYQPERKAAQANEQKAAQNNEQKPAQQAEQKPAQNAEQKTAPRADRDQVVDVWRKASEENKTAFVQRPGKDNAPFYQTFGADAAKVAHIVDKPTKELTEGKNAGLAYINIAQREMPQLMKSLKEQGDQAKVVGMDGKYARVLPEPQAKNQSQANGNDLSKYNVPEGKTVSDVRVWQFQNQPYMNGKVDGVKLPEKQISIDDFKAFKGQKTPEGQKAVAENLVGKYYSPAEMQPKQEAKQSKGVSR